MRGRLVTSYKIAAQQDILHVPAYKDQRRRFALRYSGSRDQLTDLSASGSFSFVGVGELRGALLGRRRTATARQGGWSAGVACFAGAVREAPSPSGCLPAAAAVHLAGASRANRTLDGDPGDAPQRLSS